MYTQTRLEQLQDQRRKRLAVPTLSPEGGLSAQVHRQLDAQRERAIAEHQRSLQAALTQLRQDQALSFKSGLAQAQFNHTTQEITP